MGNLVATLREIWPPKSRFEPERDMPDLSDKVAIVTGGNTGIGRETVKKNAKVYMASRTKSRAEKAIQELQAETGKTAIFLELDLASLLSVAKAIAEFKSKEPALHILFNSGGVMIPPLDETTPGKCIISPFSASHFAKSGRILDGTDLQFGTNVLGHAVFTLGLIDRLEAGAKTSGDGHARVVNTSSGGAYSPPEGSIKFDALKDGPARRKLGPWTLYFQSKYGNYVFSCELARRYADKGIISNALHPGAINTELQRNTPRIITLLVKPILHDVSYGALTQLYVGTSPETANVSGKWFVPWARQSKFLGPQNEAQLGPELWKWIEDQGRPYLS